VVRLYDALLAERLARARAHLLARAGKYFNTKVR
jgi:hypothetical protein